MVTNYIHPINTVGFEKLFARLNETVQSQTGYPPYNIVKTSENEYVIELAIAGFTLDEIDITVKAQTMTIKGTPKKLDREYLFKGIAERAFTRTLTLADAIEVVGADMKAGMLYIMLKSAVDNNSERKIPIGPKPKPLQELLNE